MSIQPPKASIAPPQAQPVLPALQIDSRARDGSASPAFGDVLSAIKAKHEDAGATTLDDAALAALAARFAEFEHGLAVQAAEQTYTLKVHIGDGALRFHARPIVAPTALDPAETPAGQPPSRSAGATAPQPNGGIANDPVKLPDEIRAEPAFMRASGDGRLSMQPIRPPAADSVPRAGPSLAPNARSTGPDLFPRHSSGHIVPETQRGANRPGARAASTASAAPPPSASARLFAQLLAASGEYRVALRGVSLSREDSERLAQNIRTALRDYGLADLPVIIATQTGKT